MIAFAAVFLRVRVACRGKGENGDKRRRTHKFKVKRSHISPCQKATKKCVSAVNDAICVPAAVLFIYMAARSGCVFDIVSAGNNLVRFWADFGTLDGSEAFISYYRHDRRALIMKKIAFLAFAGAVILGSVAASVTTFGKLKINGESLLFSRSVQGSGNIVTELREVSEFSQVSVGGVFKAEITAGKDFSVSVEADDNLLPLIETEVRGDTLKISTDSRLESARPIVVRVTAPNIAGVKASGAADVNLSGVQNRSLSLSLSGASKMTAAGNSDSVEATVSGASSLAAYDLTADLASVDTSGASRTYINASSRLFADASGASTILYKGSPEVRRNSSGASTIRAAE